MVRSPRSLSTALVALAVLLGAAGCSRPDPNPPLIVTGKQTEAIPATSSTTTTSTSTTTTTMFYGPST
jgi:hypothetical protein